MNPEDLSVEELKALLKKKQDIVVPSEQNIVVNEDFMVERPNNEDARRNPVKAKENTWSDEGELRGVETPDVERTPRARPAPVKVERVCHICGRKFMIHASLVSGEYTRCNECTGT